MNMFKRVGSIVAMLFISGCAALLNSDRPRFSGPVVKPVWSVPDLVIDKQPLIYDGIVYAQAFDANQTLLHAFDAATGKPLWVSDFASDQILAVIGPRLMVTDAKGMLHALDCKTGRAIDPPAPSTILSAVAADNILYAIWEDRSVAAMDSPGHSLWTAHVPMNFLFHPVVAGETVYIYGQTKNEKGVNLGCAIHAFHARTGALRWKWETSECGGPEDSPMSVLAADDGAAYLAIDGKAIDDKWGVVLAFDAATGKQKWTTRTVQFHPAGPLLLDASTVVVCDNIPGDHGGTANRKNPNVLRGLHTATGATLWETKTRWKYGQWTDQGGLRYIADRKDHALVNTGNETSPDSFLTVMDVRTGKELWRSETVELGSFTKPAIGDGIVVVGSVPYGNSRPAAAGLYAYRATRQGR